MFTRQKVLLSLLRAANRPVQRIELTKWAFLLRHEMPSGGGSAFFEFVPYHYGPFSFGLYQETGKLTDAGYVASDSEQWTLGPVSAPELSVAQVSQDVESVVRKFGGLKLDALLDYVYQSYPEFTSHSKRAQLIEKPVAPIAVYTCGYEGQSVDGFLNELVKTGIKRLIDVRKNPIARRYGFHKSTLARLCGNLQIDYVHVPELGIQSKLRQSLESQSDYDRLFKSYRNTTLKSEVTAIEQVEKLVLETPSVLVCMEHAACCCHRSHLAERVAANTGLEVVHLRQDDDDRQ